MTDRRRAKEGLVISTREREGAWLRGALEGRSIDGELVMLEHTGARLLSHAPSACEGRPCPLHNRTDHVMRSFPQHWRSDRALMERMCPHGVGHPDYDAYPYYYETYGKKRADAEFVHGCDGCCQPAPVWMEEYTDAERT